MELWYCREPTYTEEGYTITGSSKTGLKATRSDAVSFCLDKHTKNVFYLINIA